MSPVLRPLGLSLACLGLSFACATAQDDPFLQGTGGRVDTAGKGGGGGTTAGTAGQTGKGGSAGKGGTGGSAGSSGQGGGGGTSGGGTGGTDGGGGDDTGSSGADAGGMGGAPGPDPCAPEGTPPEIHVLLQNESTRIDEDPKGSLRLVNDTDDDLPLGEVTVRYYFTSEFECSETLEEMEINVTYFQLYNDPFVDAGVASVLTNVVQLEDHGRTCDAYFELGFSSTTPALEPGAEAALGLWTQIPINDGTKRDQTNDFSYGACRTKRVWWDRVTVYRDGVRVSGTGPDNDSGEGGAGGQGGQGGQGGLGGAGGEAGATGGQGGLGGSGGANEGGEGGVTSEGGAGGESSGGAGNTGGAGESSGGAGNTGGAP